jgi:sulfite reductase alpha subunit-like flavoprotein
MLKVLNSTYDYTFTISSKKKEKLPLPSPITLNNYLKNFVDLNGEIGTADLLKLEELLSEADFDKVSNFVQSKKNAKEIFDLVDLLENVQISKGNLLSVLISLNKRIEPRTYTICSSNVISPTIVQIVVSGSLIKGSKKLGLFSQFVQDADISLRKNRKEPLFVQAKIHDSAFKFPNSPNTPVKQILEKLLTKN